MKVKAKKVRRSRPARGTLVAIAALLLGSVIVRIGSNAGQAFARGATHDEVAVQKPAAECEPPQDIALVLEAFQKREQRIETQESQIQSRLQALRIADQKIEEKLAALSQAESKLKQTLALADTAAEDDLSKLTIVYESMKPKDAAALFEQMAPEFSAGFLGRMKPASAASIMAGLTAERAYTISVILAGRNANVPKE